MKKKILFVSILIIGIGVCGCSMKLKHTDTTVDDTSKTESSKDEKLNKRQKEILEQEGLPTNYEELYLTQQIAIEEIEELLEVLENKYGINFIYDGYIAKGFMQDETLYAYAENNRDALVTIVKKKKDHKVIYEDNYLCTVVRPDYEAYIMNYFKNTLKLESVKIYADISEVFFDEIPTGTINVDNNIISGNVIFIDSKDIDEEKLEMLVNNYNSWIMEHDIHGINQLIFLKENYYEEVTRYNYSDFLSDEFYVARVNCDNNSWE